MTISIKSLVLYTSVSAWSFAALIPAAFAQGASDNSEQPIATDPVFLFNEICYTQVPDVKSIQDMAKRFAWVPMGDEDLQQITSFKTPSLLDGWDIRLGERIYRLGIVQSEANDSFIRTFPDMAGGTITGCTMVLDGQDDAQTIFDRLNVLLGKEPASRDVPEGELLTTTWAGGNDKVKVIVFLKTDADNRANLMNLTFATN